MPSLAGTKTEKNLKTAFAKSSKANLCYLYFARQADLEGYNDISAVFRSTAEGARCRVEIAGATGWIERHHQWGVTPDETVK